MTARQCAFFDSRSVEIVKIVWKEAQLFIHSKLSIVGGILTKVLIHNMTVTKFRVETMLTEIRCSLMAIIVFLICLYD